MSGKNKHKWRIRKSNFVVVLAGICTLLVIVPLFLILFYTVQQGISSINWDFFTRMPKPVGESGGGMANALVGSGILVLIGSVFGIPVGVMSGIYLSEHKKGALSKSVRFLVEVLNGTPSIVIGIVAYITFVVPMKSFSALSGGVALGILMIPLITRTTEEMLLLVPSTVREASFGLGISKWKTTLFIVLPAALKGLLTGIILSIARAAGETAPLLFTALGNRFWSTNIDEPIASITVFIYDYAKAPFDDWNRQAWAASLVLIVFVTTLNIIFKVVSRKRK